MKRKNHKSRSLRVRIIAAFCGITLLPIICVQFLSYFNTASEVRNNMNQLEKVNLSRTKESVSLRLTTYEDLLYQLYTSDEIVEMINARDQTGDMATYRFQLRRFLRGIANVRSDVQAITVITTDGEAVFYDKLTASEKTSWMTNYDTSVGKFLEKNLENRSTKIYPTKYASEFSGEPYYLFHMVHRVVDYRNFTRQLGLVIVSVDEKVLSETCNLQTQNDSGSAGINFIIDEQGNLISYPDSSKIGVSKLNVSELKKSCVDFTKKELPSENASVQTVYDKDLGWYFINISDQSEVISEIEGQLKISLLTLFVSIAVLITIIILISRRLTSSVERIVKAMKTAGRGLLTVQIKEDAKMPVEVISIADQFNKMILKINGLVNEIKDATVKQKDAEIAMLEAQLNPHFLYNTLDTINWMAIDHEEYEISDTISSLGEILRYSIDQSNSLVPVQKEVEWLRQYLFLQQTRMKNQFSYEIQAEPAVLEWSIHKLLFQPFVENAVVHGFQGESRAWKLLISIAKTGEGKLQIVISDNGQGMSEETINRALQLSVADEKEKSHIGMGNAVGRLRLYYDGQYSLNIESKLQAGTRITIEIAKLGGENLENCGG